MRKSICMLALGAFWSGMVFGTNGETKMIEKTVLYEVPTHEARLQAEAHYPISSRIEVRADGGATITYDLPPELMGEEVEVQFEREVRADELKVFKGPNGTLSCQDAWARLKCVVRFKGLQFNERAVRNHLSESFTPERAAVKMELAALFHHEVIGFVRELPPEE